ncbi:MAG: hypothetical protein JO284_04880 [Planctomycetaceae bacterium]|nr:hypothetical protein [Planctomycetaceae bacterium]MBV8233987.1 hypothetical protein [Planctomycetaceae bacterium]MBV8313338.1 hypothetical protein [Planctomycetaceae bacterium]MBV8383330.1 hypothetical protein [Planctomycetaceae bacterium]
MPDAIRTAALRRVAELLQSPDLTPRDLASLLRTLVAFDRTDMLDEKLTLDRAKWAAGRPNETVETAADLARQLLDAARGHLGGGGQEPTTGPGPTCHASRPVLESQGLGAFSPGHPGERIET